MSSEGAHSNLIHSLPGSLTIEHTVDRQYPDTEPDSVFMQSHELFDAIDNLTLPKTSALKYTEYEADYSECHVMMLVGMMTGRCRFDDSRAMYDPLITEYVNLQMDRYVAIESPWKVQYGSRTEDNVYISDTGTKSEDLPPLHPLLVIPRGHTVDCDHEDVPNLHQESDGDLYDTVFDEFQAVIQHGHVPALSSTKLDDLPYTVDCSEPSDSSSRFRV